MPSVSPQVPDLVTSGHTRLQVPRLTSHHRLISQPHPNSIFNREDECLSCGKTALFFHGNLGSPSRTVQDGVVNLILILTHDPRVTLHRAPPSTWGRRRTEADGERSGYGNVWLLPEECRMKRARIDLRLRDPFESRS